MSNEQASREVAGLLFGAAGDDLIAKMNPVQSDVATHDRRKRAITAGLSAVGGAAGAGGLGYSGYKFGQAARAARKIGKPAIRTAIRHEKGAALLFPLELAGLGGEVMATHILHGDTKKPPMMAPPKKKPGVLVSKDLGDVLNQAKDVKPTPMGLTRAAVSSPKIRKKGLEYTKKGVGQLRKLPEQITTHNEVEKRSPTWGIAARGMKAGVKAGIEAKPGGIRHAKQAVAMNTAKASEELASAATEGRKAAEEVHRTSRIARRAATGLGIGAVIGATAGAGAGGYAAGKKLRRKISADITKQDVDVIWSGEFAKADADKQQVFGWASVVEVGGQPVVDLQGDFISVDEMEKAAYSYVQKSRKGGDMHLRNDWEPVQKSEMIESFIVTPEKRAAMGLPDNVPSGWWVGFQVTDPDIWAMIRSGERTGFSIHGRGHRSPL